MSLATYSFSPHDLAVSAEELSFAMGYKPDSVPSPLRDCITQALQDSAELIHPSGGYRIAEAVQFFSDRNEVRIESAVFHVKKVIFQQLLAAKAAAVFVCTAGNDITERSVREMKSGEPLRGYVYGMLGSVAVEKAMDRIQESLHASMRQSNRGITNRFSPGYCGWETSEQRQLFSLLPDRFCGVDLTASCMMRPVKSVSGIIGIGRDAEIKPYPCDLCDESDCLRKNLPRHERA